MKLIIGIGNPGQQYKNTRHSAGYMVADALASEISNSKSQISNKSKILIFKSPNFMNDSGSFVKKLVDQYKLDLSDLYVIHDDLDIPFGSFKIQFGRGPKDHNGILDIEEKLGTKEFNRVRVGIDNRPQDNKPMGEVYTLENFTDEEKEKLDNVIKEVCKKLVTSD
ncbi:MAG TPA: aminoacyl-tRNA hydrolase [Patescibacteria group bacterium]|nr:aminoacyl-tRNA hydrolase [Patescibacteria group bacterium]